MGNVSKRGWSFGILGCAGCPFFVLFHREKVWRGLHLDGKKFSKVRKTAIFLRKSFWKFWKKFSLRVLFWPQFGEKTGIGRTTERKFGEERSESRCGRWKIGRFREGDSQKIFQKYFDFFVFSPSVCPSADTSLVRGRQREFRGFCGRFVNRPYCAVILKTLCFPPARFKRQSRLHCVFRLRAISFWAKDEARSRNFAKQNPAPFTQGSRRATI